MGQVQFHTYHSSQSQPCYGVVAGEGNIWGIPILRTTKWGTLVLQTHPIDETGIGALQYWPKL
jgi:hypothetical protein